MNKNIYLVLIFIVFLICIFLWLNKYIFQKQNSPICPKQFNQISSTNFNEFKNQITFKEINNNYFASKIPSYFGTAYYSGNNSQLGEGYQNSYAIASSKSELYIIIDIIKTKQKDIPLWEKNECQSDVFCKSYDYRDPVTDNFDEHYSYIYSGANWETIRNKDIILIIYEPYFQGTTEEEQFLVENFIKNLKFTK